VNKRQGSKNSTKGKRGRDGNLTSYRKRGGGEVLREGEGMELATGVVGALMGGWDGWAVQLDQCRFCWFAVEVLKRLVALMYLSSGLVAKGLDNK
jgi:hypothetical protein